VFQDLYRIGTTSGETFFFWGGNCRSRGGMKERKAGKLKDEEKRRNHIVRVIRKEKIDKEGRRSSKHLKGEPFQKPKKEAAISEGGEDSLTTAIRVPVQ